MNTDVPHCAAHPPSVWQWQIKVSRETQKIAWDAFVGGKTGWLMHETRYTTLVSHDFNGIAWQMILCSTPADLPHAANHLCQVGQQTAEEEARILGDQCCLAP